MAARNDQAVWWTGKTDAEIAQHYAKDAHDFYTGMGNYSDVGGPCRFGDVPNIAAPGAVCDSLDDDSAQESSNVLADAAVVLAALAKYDAADKRRKLADTARGVMLAKVDVNTGRPCMTDLARALNVSRPSAIGRFQKLLEVTSSVEFQTLMVECRGI